MFLFIALVLFSLVWFAPAAYQIVSTPVFHVEKPPGEGVAPKIILTRSYDDMRDVGLIAGLVLTQILAIWYRRRAFNK